MRFKTIKIRSHDTITFADVGIFQTSYFGFFQNFHIFAPIYHRRCLHIFKPK